MTPCSHAKLKARNYHLEVDRERAFSFLLSLLNCCQILIWTISQFHFGYTHMHSGFGIKQPRCEWRADIQCWFSRFHKNGAYRLGNQSFHLHSISFSGTEKYWTTTKQMRLGFALTMSGKWHVCVTHLSLCHFISVYRSLPLLVYWTYVCSHFATTEKVPMN